MSSPASHEKPGAPAATGAGGSAFLRAITIDHGPPAVLGRFFLIAERYLADLGITLAFGMLSQANDVQEANIATWPHFPPMLDGRYGAIAEDQSYCLFGRDANGAIVTCQGGRIYAMGPRTFADIVADQSFLYGEGGKPAAGGTTCEITAPSARHVTGTIVYSGALWVDPRFRGHDLGGLLPRISRAYALARFGTDFTIAWVRPEIAQTPMLKAYAYPHAEQETMFRRLHGRDVGGCFLWMDRAELIAELRDYLSRAAPEVDGAVGGAGAENQRRSVRVGDR